MIPVSLGEIGLPESGNLSLDLLFLGSECLLESFNLNLLNSKFVQLLISLLTPLKRIECRTKVARSVFELDLDIIDKVLGLLILERETELQEQIRPESPLIEMVCTVV